MHEPSPPGPRAIHASILGVTDPLPAGSPVLGALVLEQARASLPRMRAEGCEVEVCVRFCVEPGCSEMVEGRRVAYCSEHEPARPAWLGSKSRQMSGWQWSKIRRRVMARDRYRCRWCGETATQVDAIVNSARGGSHFDLGNLQALCDDCHTLKTERERKEGLGQ